ncbi:hypothetical protein SAMD00019534_112800 [Acytostelium subglobosum LB1]|uniref:hypothetical protein n=1 Tax=Acytostelium subglobosum LB1 TaxID=1410327 RepID=UPI0006449124|nr:hypothetical protein SAMD00019534_112800 [Acytostelium subglobosum LB1]GAM28104.1 hypothetical protein SAMD00019534_112800 [Acytostelium subglobosum LB1]|eukprot:XP_012749063.1 hypothetical protein SAMD00019534_112800 [Acytostelium subglobosum LB1]
MNSQQQQLNDRSVGVNDTGGDAVVHHSSSSSDHDDSDDYEVYSDTTSNHNHDIESPPIINNNNNSFIPRGSTMVTNEYGDIQIHVPPHVPNSFITPVSTNPYGTNHGHGLLNYHNNNHHLSGTPSSFANDMTPTAFHHQQLSRQGSMGLGASSVHHHHPSTDPAAPTDHDPAAPAAIVIEDPKKEERRKKKKQAIDEAQSVPFMQLFRFSDGYDKALMLLGTLAAMANGAALPCVTIIFGHLIDAFNPQKFNDDPTYSIQGAITEISIWFLYLGGMILVLSYLETTLWTLAGERQINRARVEYLSSILRQEIGWFDTNKANELASRINSDTILFQDAIGEKVGHFIHHLTTFFTGFAIGFTNGWQLTLVILSVSPLLAIGGGFMAKMMTEMTKKGQEAYSIAGGIAEESISSIRTVVTFSGESKVAQRYSDSLKEARSVGYKRALFNGIGLGFVQFVILSTYALAFWYGSTLVSKKTTNNLTDRPWTGGDVVTVFFGVIIGATAIGQASPLLSSFSNGRGAAYKIFQVIDRVSKANPFSTRGKRLDHLTGEIEFRNVSFAYPSRPDAPVFQDFNLAIKPGQTIGLVGDSGGGKSTVISLLERFYDPLGGQILIDGEDIKKLNVRSLRSKIGLVSQEPVLFATSIAENIRYGKEDATQEEIEAAARQANAHSFIVNLPQGYNTMVGEKGVQMSGGQKQRIAIARAIIKNPNILLLDEATSALDSENERIVQEAIDILMKGRTSILIAHRLSTIRHADVIVYVKGGQVVERGSHEELIRLQGHYYGLVERQSQQQQLMTESSKVKRNSTLTDIHPYLESFRVSKRNVHARDRQRDRTTKTKKKTKKQKKDVPFSRVLKQSSDDMWLFLFGFLSAVGTGAIYPVFSIVFARMLTILQNPDPNYITTQADFFSIMFTVLAIGSAVSNFFQTFLFGVIGEKLTYKLRSESFKTIIRQNIGWFDLSEHSTGKLTTHLASDASLVQGMTSQRLGIMLQNFLTIIGGLIIALYSGWKLTLVIIATVPLIVITGKLQMKFLKGFSSDDGDGTGAAGQVASEAITGIRTVASFTTENQVLDLYKKQLKIPIAKGQKKAHIAGISFGVSNFILYGVYCLSFWYGSVLVGQREWPASAQEVSDNCNAQTIPAVWKDMETCTRAIDMLSGFSQLIRVFFAIVLSAIGVGQTSSFAPDLAKAQVAANEIFHLLDQQSSIDGTNPAGDTIPIVTGDIVMKNIDFAYPSRPNQMVFQGFNLNIQSGTRIALVGDSGGGKSTVISLLERFYDPLQGEIFIDGYDIRQLNIKHLRSLFGLVGQEPVLFSGTIAENIAYGHSEATQEEIERAARSANAHDFIINFPDRYNTQIGDKFTQLSGGQKQRIAIARAILRNPKILLLDEATSALDAESEKLVQDALENIMKGRTTLIIAHRLTTIQNADCIAFVRSGKIFEKGTHQELLEKGVHYSQLISRQLS